MDCTQKSCTKYPCNTYHMKRIQSPIMKPLKEQNKSEDCSDPKTWCKEPTRLPQRINQENRYKDRNRCRKSNCIIRTQPYRTCNFKLTKHKSNKCKRSMKSYKRPQSPKLKPTSQISFRFWTPQKKQRMPYSIRWSRNGHSKKIASFKIRRSKSMSIPRSYKCGSCQPST
jgi:hypothetical protein